MKEETTLMRVKTDDHKQIKVLAAIEAVTMQDVLTKLINAYKSNKNAPRND